MPYADPASYERGDLSSEAVGVARSFTDFPVVWLGETFHDFPLTHVERQEFFIPKEESVWGRDTGRDSLLLVYGTCTPDPDELEASCVPPLQIIVDAGLLVPPPEMVSPDANASELFDFRGVQAMHISTGTTLWFDNGLTVTVHANTDLRLTALDLLALANPAAFGLEPVVPGESLAPVGEPAISIQGGAVAGPDR